MALCKKRVQIDKARLCFRAEPSLIQILESIGIGEHLYFNKVCLRRVYEDDSYRNVYHIYGVNNDCTEMYFGKLKINLKLGGETGNKFDDNMCKLWIAIDNRVLYHKEYLRFIYSIAEELQIAINNFTILELCRDLCFNVSRLIKKFLHDSSLNTILNDVVINDRRAERPEIIYDYCGSLYRQLQYLTVYIKQKKALKDKSKEIKEHFPHEGVKYYATEVEHL